MKKNTIIIAGALIAGFLGGTFSSTFFNARNAQAQRTNSISSLRGLQIVDEYGNTRIRMGVFSSDEPGICFYDKRGQTCARLTGREVVFYDNAGNDCLVLGLDSWEQKPSLYFKNRDEQTQLAIELDSIRQGQPSIFLYDEFKNVRLCLGNISFKDKKTGNYVEEPFSAAILDNNGEVLWKAP